MKSKGDVITIYITDVKLQNIPMPDDDYDEDVCIFRKIGRCMGTKSRLRSLSPTSQVHIKK